MSSLPYRSREDAIVRHPFANIDKQLVEGNGNTLIILKMCLAILVLLLSRVFLHKKAMDSKGVSVVGDRFVQIIQFAHGGEGF